MIAPLDPRQTLLNVARGHNWVVEVGSNTGQAVNAILARVGLPPGQPWCAAFVAYIGWLVLRERWPLGMVGGCVSLSDEAVAKRLRRVSPAAGSIFLLWHPNATPAPRFGHTGFIWDQLPSGKWRTVEGNTNAGGSPEGTGVFVRERTFAAEDRFINWWEDPV